LNRFALIAATLILASAAMADEATAPPKPAANPKVEQALQQSLPICSAEHTTTTAEFPHKLPPNLHASLIQIQSKRSWCEGQWTNILSTNGGFFLGSPWFLEDAEGKTIEEKLKNFTWTHMQENYEATVDRHETRDGLYNVVLTQTTEHGKVPLTGVVDPKGEVFLLGHFYALGNDVRQERLKNLEPYMAGLPSEGASKPVVTIIEFSDFQCPACQRAAGYLDPVMSKYSDKVRYVRYDLPLMSHHPWAFAAALAGRAIWRQKPDAFWEFKKQIYANQDKLSTFTIDEFTRGFAQDHDLDLKKYDADVADPKIQQSVLDGIGMAFSTDVRSTPTYFVNGQPVDPGDEGKALEAYVAGLVGK